MLDYVVTCDPICSQIIGAEVTKWKREQVSKRLREDIRNRRVLNHEKAIYVCLVNNHQNHATGEVSYKYSRIDYSSLVMNSSLNELFVNTIKHLSYPPTS